MRQRDGEAPAPPAGRLDSEAPPETLERRVEEVEAGRRRRKAAVPVTRAASLLDSSQVEERVGQLVARPLAAVDLLPGPGVVRKLVAKAHVVRSQRCEDPAGAPLDALGDHRASALYTRPAGPRSRRAPWTSAGRRSSRASIGST